MGCGQFKPLAPAYVDPRIQSYLEEYKLDKKIYLGTYNIKRIDIYFKDLEHSIYNQYDALCWKESNGHRYIEIDYNKWNNDNNDDKITTLYHEMGHCDLDLKHSSTQTIMNPAGLLGIIFATDKNFYLNKLFKEGI